MSENRIGQLIELESDVKYQESPSVKQPEYQYVSGILPILISAPHGAVQTRDKKPKEEDEYTAGLALLVGEITGAHVLYARRKSVTDPNADPEAPYKVSLKEVVGKNNIKFVVDLHGANEKRPFGIALGTMHGRSCSEAERQTIIRNFENFGFSDKKEGLRRLDIDKTLPAEGKNGHVPITMFCKNNSIHAAQIELNAFLRIPIRRDDATHYEIPFSGDPDFINVSIESLSAMVSFLADTKTVAKK